MKNYLITSILLLVFSMQAQAQTKFVLEPSQSMCMTGKGSGQDATINPFAGQECIAVIKNIGKLPFNVRIQEKGDIIKTITIKRKETQKITLFKNQVLYFDSNDKGKSKAKITYEQI
ncbi:MAG: hypothetical protein AAF616_01810 [Bacteroidota bacterium]